MNEDFISITAACELLQISRPTLNKYRDEYKLREFKVRQRVYLSKLEIIEKVIYSIPNINKQNILLSALTFDKNLKLLFLQNDIVDLRGNIGLDAFCIISLLCLLKNLIKNDNKNIYLLVSNTPFCRYLKKLGFFHELEKSNVGKVFFDEARIKDDQLALKGSVILPLHLLGYKGAEKKVIEELYSALIAQGFSEKLSGYLGWVIGELSDNCHTHSKGGACYLMIESKSVERINYKFLSIVIGDIGIGIHHSLKTNTKYEHLSDLKAFITAFMSNVSSWPDEHNRGKGLNDILGIGIGNEAWIRCESGPHAIFADFSSQQKKINIVQNLTDTSGTRIGLILIDNTFKDIPRSEVNIVVNNLLEKI